VKLTQAQLDALRIATNKSGRLYRWPGGYWLPERGPTTAAHHEANRDARPEDRPYTTIHTVRALESRGLLARANEYPDEYRDTRLVTEAGWAAAGVES